jgi:hypothetical protein
MLRSASRLTSPTISTPYSSGWFTATSSRLLPAGMSTFGQASGIEGVGAGEGATDGAADTPGDGIPMATGGGDPGTIGRGATSIRIANENDDKVPAGHSSHPGGGSFVPQARKS